MKTVVVLATLVTLAIAVSTPSETYTITNQIKTVDAVSIERQKKLLSLTKHVTQVEFDDEYYKIGKYYDIKANINNYTNKKAVEEFLALYRDGFLPKYWVFSVLYEEMRKEAIALFHLFYYAKDFDTFYKTAAFARVHLNEAQFLYTFYIAVMHREDTVNYVLPPPYEVFPQFFVNSDVFTKINHLKMQQNITNAELAAQYGVVQEYDNYIFYANYSSYVNFNNEEQKLSYFTEDIGLNSYYYYFHSQYPFWMEGKYFSALKDRLGEGTLFFYQRLMARYYMERLVNNLGEIPDFSWREPFQNGYKPFLFNYGPFAQRNNYHSFVTENNFEDLRFLDAYEKNFVKFLENGQFTVYNQKVDFHDSKAINFVGNYWESNIDLYEKTQPRNYLRSYQAVARRVIGTAPEVYDKYTILPSALVFYQTSLRDPAFFQLYSRITKYMFEFKKYLKPYTQETLQFNGVKIKDVQIDPLVTYFDQFDFDVTNGVFVTTQEYKSCINLYKVRQPRLNHKPFTITIDVKSDLASESVVKIFLGPKYDSNGYPIALEDNWMNFVELDWFNYTLTPGHNKIQRNSRQFLYFENDRVTTPELYKMLDESKIPEYRKSAELPNRLMLPRGTKSGFPFQIFVIIYPSEPVTPEYKIFFKEDYVKDLKPLGYPLDRPPKSIYFNLSNIHFEDVFIYHEGEKFSYKYNVPSHAP